MRKLVFGIFALMLSAGPVALGQAATEPTEVPKDLPTSWVDPDTGHMVHRLTSEPNSTGFYFNINAYTPDAKEMVYSAPDGIHVLELASGKTRLVVAGKLRAMVWRSKTAVLFSGMMRLAGAGMALLLNDSKTKRPPCNSRWGDAWRRPWWWGSLVMRFG